MSIFDQAYYLFKPTTSEGAGIFYHLKPVEEQSQHCLVIVPYVHPARQAITPRYFQILSETETSLPVGNHRDNNLIRLKASQNKQNYLNTIQQLKQHIQRGDIYEINYCLQFASENTTIAPLEVFSRLHNIGKAPYSMLLRLQNEYILCESPELFLKKNGLTLETKPIKGTAARGENTARDAEIKFALHNNIKERTENVMAVDVARNDLSMLAARDSVRVNKLYNIETFETVHQMVSTVSCELKRNFSLAEILQATFPMASMTGAPKRRAMDLIEEYESFERGLYSGTIGLCKADSFELAVVIRSVFYHAENKHVSVAVGGAITHLSEAEQEYEECLLKARAMLTALGAIIV